MNNLIKCVGLLLLCSCGTSATIQTYQGGYYTGRITGHDRDGAVYIGGRRVESEDISDIDHPGNVAAIIGGIVTGIGALSATNNCSKEVYEQDPQPCKGSGIWLLTGIPIMIYGIVTHSGSTSRAGQ